MRNGNTFKHHAAFMVICTASLLIASPVKANPQGQATKLIMDAMTAYGNLDLDSARNNLDYALSMSPQLNATTVARIYISYGVLSVGGLGDNSRGQESFTIARCLDGTIQIDPLYSTPEVDMIFRMAQSRVNPQTCGQLLVNVRFGTPPQPAAPQPMMPQPQPMAPQPQPMAPQPVAPGALPPCGNHTPPLQQRTDHELPLSIHLNPQADPHIARLVIHYAFDGATTFYDLPMQKMGNGWASGMISCRDGQITMFNPRSIAYYIEGFNANGALICGHGSAQQLFQVTMNPDAQVVAGLPGQPAPELCKECPPWDQACLARSGQPIPCFTDEDCIAGQTCSFSGFCEGGDVAGTGDRKKKDRGASGDVPKTFYVNLTGGAGGGFFSDNSTWFLNTGTNTGNVDGLYAWYTQSTKGGGWSGIPLRLALGFNIKPAFSIEATFRIDLSAAFRPQRDALACDGPDGSTDGSGYTCYNPLRDEGEGIFGVWGFETDGNTYLYAANTKKISNAWLINLRGRGRFVNDGPLQVSFFGGIGYGHLFFAPKKSDIDFDGVTDRRIVTPGPVHIELGPGLAYYFTPNVGFVLDIPITLGFGKGTFGMNAELAIGLSFGG